VLAGTGPRNGEPRKNPRVSEVGGNPVPLCEDFLVANIIYSIRDGIMMRFTQSYHTRALVPTPPPAPPGWAIQAEHQQQ
jgi:hypothetical protein